MHYLELSGVFQSLLGILPYPLDTFLGSPGTLLIPFWNPYTDPLNPFSNEVLCWVPRRSRQKQPPRKELRQGLKGHRQERTIQRSSKCTSGPINPFMECLAPFRNLARIMLRITLSGIVMQPVSRGWQAVVHCWDGRVSS